MSDPKCYLPNGLLDPDMPTQTLRLQMGELTENEVLVARAAIGWANRQDDRRSTNASQRSIADLRDEVAEKGRVGTWVVYTSDGTRRTVPVSIDTTPSHVGRSNPYNVRVEDFEGKVLWQRLDDLSVPQLAWQEPTARTNGCWVARTPVGDYSVAFDDGWHADNMDLRWEWESPLDPRSYEGPSAAQQACELHYRNLIAEMLGYGGSGDRWQTR